MIHAIARISVGCWIVSTLLVGDFAAGESLRYRWEKGKRFAYRVTATIDLPTEVTTYSGVIRYTVDDSNDEQSRLTYRGGTSESNKYKRSARSGRFGPRGFGPFGPRRPSIPSPFSRPTFAGKIQTTNRITLSSQGNALAMEGDSQLPFLIGNVSLLPFESLPEGDEPTWKVDSGVSITKGNNDRRRFGPFDPFAANDPESVKAAGEVTTYAIKSKDSNTISVEKTYRLTSPKAGDQPGYDIKGEGTWVFNAKERLSESLDFKFDLTVEQSNTKVTFPVAIKYHRVSDEELAKLDAEAKAKKEEAARKAAEMKRQREAPLTSQETEQTLAALASSNTPDILPSLKMLAGKSPKNPDPQIAAAVRPLLEHSNKKVAEDAHKALVKWSPQYKLKADLNTKYNRASPVESTGRKVTESTRLYKGQIVQVRYSPAFWFAADVLEALPDGRVMVRLRGRGSLKQDKTLPREQVQLAPDEIDQPLKPAGLVAEGPAMRTWTDSTGKHKIEAVFLELDGDKVKLRRKDGKELSVPISRLGQADQTVAKQLAASTPNDNPFE